MNEKNGALVGAGRDLLILLFFMWHKSMGHIIMKCEGAKKHGDVTRNMGELAKCLPDLGMHMIFIFGECDITSEII